VAFRIRKEAELDANKPSSNKDALFVKRGTALSLHSNFDNNNKVATDYWTQEEKVLELDAAGQSSSSKRREKEEKRQFEKEKNILKKKDQRSCRRDEDNDNGSAEANEE